MAARENWSFTRGSGRLYPSIDASNLSSYTSSSIPPAQESPASNFQSSPQVPLYYVQSPSQVSIYAGKSPDRYVTPFSSAPSSPVSRTLSYQTNLEEAQTSFADSEADNLPSHGVRRSGSNFSTWKNGRVQRWKNLMDEESVVLLSERDVPKSPDVEDFKHLCWRVVVMTTLLTVFLLASATLLFWIVCQPKAPLTTFDGIKFEHFQISAGSDRTGVPTQVISMDSLLDISFYNPSRYYGVSVKRINVSIAYIRNLASAKVEEFYQTEDSGRLLSVRLASSLTPMYGAASAILDAQRRRDHINLSLNLEIHSQVAMFRGMLHRHFKKSIKCDVLFDPYHGKAMDTSCEPNFD